MAYIKNEAFIVGNKFEISKKDEIKITADINRVIISIDEYDNYKFCVFKFDFNELQIKYKNQKIN